MYPNIHIFSLKLSSYGILALVGVLLATLLVALLMRRDNKKALRRPLLPEVAIMATPFALAGFLLGAHLLYALTNIDEFVYFFKHHDAIMKGLDFKGRLGQYIELIRVNAGGIVFYGGLFGALGGALIYFKCERTKPDWRAYFDLLAPSVPLFHAFGRVGCFMSGCCYGVKCDSFGFVFNNSIVSSANGVRRFPVQLLEAAGDIMIFIVLLVLYLKFREKWRSGAFIRLYFLMYGILRFADEFLRGDKYRGIWLGLSTSQWISLALLAGVALSFVASIMKKDQSIDTDALR